VIKLTNYSKKYGSFVAVHPTDMHIKAGEVYALLGPNGGGKTSLLKSVVGLSQPDTGTVRIANEYLWEKPEKVKAQLSFLPQRVNLPENLTVGEVLDFFAALKNASPQRITEILDLIDIKAEMSQRTGTLSGGMLQRLGLVITFLADTPVYVLDEPTLNLDMAGVRGFRRYLRQLKANNKTVLFTSHAMVDAESLADRVAVMTGGRLALEQTVADFRNKVKDQSNMVLVLAGRDQSLVEVALNNGAIEAEFENGFFRYRADQVVQIKVLEAIRKTGADIISISTEKPSLDQLVEEHYE
jgi:ABC-2 type transport system ATP-binding protein